MDLNDYRKEIDSIDDQLIALFAKRMETAEKIAAYKKANGLRVLDARREKEKMREILDKTPGDLREYVSSLYSLIFELSRSRQICPRKLPRPSKRRRSSFPRTPPSPVRAWRARIPSRHAKGSSSARAHSFSAPSRRCSPPLIRACANTAFCRWKTAQQVLSMRCTTSCRSTTSLLFAASACA